MTREWTRTLWGLSLALVCLLRSDRILSPDPLRDYQQILGWMLGQTPVIPAFEGLRQRDCLQLEASLGYIVSSRAFWYRVRPCGHRKRREEGDRKKEEGRKKRGRGRGDKRKERRREVKVQQAQGPGVHVPTA